jgi:small GTP-binding protein
MTVVIAGRPNAGKSSVLNALAGYEAAIVTPVAGTTRDVLREHIAIDGMPLHVLDTAGLRSTVDVVEAEGIRRARAEIAKADRVLFIVDASNDPQAEAWLTEKSQWPAGLPVTLVFNKIDQLEASSVNTLTTSIPSDVDHVLAVPIYDPERCSLGFHPLHTAPAVVLSVALAVVPLMWRQGRERAERLTWPRAVHVAGVGLLLHMALDWSDCVL